MDFDVTKVKTTKGGAVWIHNSTVSDKMPVAGKTVGTKVYNTNIWGINGYYDKGDLGDEVWELMAKIEFKARATKGASPRAEAAKVECVELLLEVVSKKPSSSLIFESLTSKHEKYDDEIEDILTDDSLMKDAKMSDFETSMTKKEMVSLAKDLFKRTAKFFSPAFGQSSDSSIRLFNTITHIRKPKEIASYCSNYLRLCDNPASTALTEQMKSDEFKAICDDFCKLPESPSIVNQRLTIYFGPPGTGKTYTTLVENPGIDVMVCKSTMDPSDLVEVFDFKDENGNPTFKLTPLGRAMVEGKKICLDEINLLNMDCARTLQGYLDGKGSVITERGKLIEIKDGFEVIGTMNLAVDGQVYSLPSPLVDRCKVIKEFKLTTDELVKLIYEF